MDDMSRALDEDLLKELECPVCMEYMVPPIKLCTNGHNICSKCRESVQRCPTCRSEFLETRNLTLENIVRRQKYPCANRQSGCLELLPIEHISEHHADCVHKKLKCPLHSFTNCSWNGLKHDVKEHVNAAHPGKLLERSEILAVSIKDSFAVISCFGELYVFRKQTKNGRFYCAVQLFSTSSEASNYKCEFTLRAANGIEQITKIFLVGGYSEDWETVFISGKCLNLDEETKKLFVIGNELNLTVTLSKL